MDAILVLEKYSSKPGEIVNKPVHEERELVEKAKTDPEAFGILYDNYYDRIYNFILRRTASVAIAEDLTSNTFFKALDKLSSFKWMNVPFSAWLYRIATNEVNYFYRKNKRVSQSIDENLEETLEDDNSSADSAVNQTETELQWNKLFVKLHETIITLKPKYQEVIALRYFEEKSIKEISEILSKAEGTVKSLLHRGLEKLKQKIDPSLYEEVVK